MPCRKTADYKICYVKYITIIMKMVMVADIDNGIGNDNNK